MATIFWGTVCPEGPNCMGTICPEGPINWGPFVQGDRKGGTGSPGTKCVGDQMRLSLFKAQRAFMLSLFTRCCLPEGGLFRCSLVVEELSCCSCGGIRVAARAAAADSNVWHYQTSYCTAALDGLNGLSGLFVGSRGGHHLSKPISN